jgi:hypothetical protein
VVAPAGARTEPEVDERLSATTELEEESATEDEAAQASLFPASIGITFRVERSCARRLRVRADWGEYLRVDNPEGKVWQREPRGGDRELELRPGRVELGAPDTDAPEVQVEAKVREAGEQWSVTLFLRNKQAQPAQNRDAAWLFQATLSVEAPGANLMFAARHASAQADEEELRRLALAYRNRCEFAVGHGVAVHATLIGEDPTHATRLETRAFPRREVAQVRPPTADDEPALRGLELGHAPARRGGRRGASRAARSTAGSVRRLDREPGRAARARRGRPRSRKRDRRGRARRGA